MTVRINMDASWDVLTLFLPWRECVVSRDLQDRSKRTGRCLSPAVRAFKTSPSDSDDLWSSLKGQYRDEPWDPRQYRTTRVEPSPSQAADIRTLAMRVRQYRVSELACGLQAGV